MRRDGKLALAAMAIAASAALATGCATTSTHTSETTARQTTPARTLPGALVPTPPAPTDPGPAGGQRIPSAARAVTLSLQPNMNTSAKPTASVTITNPTAVARLAALIDGLPLFPPGTYSCPADFGTALVLTFRASPGGPALAVATIELSGCEGIDLTVSDARQPSLGTPDAGRTVAAQALKIAGLHWRLT